MKLSISLPDEDVEFVDRYVQLTGGTHSRSSVLHRAIMLLREAELDAAYADVFDQWNGSPDAMVWESAARDGLSDETG